MNVDNFNAWLLKYDDCLSYKVVTFISSCTTQIIHWEIILYPVLMYSPILATETHSKCLDLKRLMCKQSFMRKACSWERPNGINCKENIHVSLNLEVHCKLRNGTQRWKNWDGGQFYIVPSGCNAVHLFYLY